MEEPIIKVYEPLKIPDLKREYIHVSVPKPAFRMIFVGQTGSGKSNLMKNMLFSNGWYKDYFDQIYIWCGSADDVDEYERLASITKYKVWNEDKNKYYKSKKESLDEKLSVTQGVDVEDLTELFHSLEDDGENSTLMVYDDMIVDNLLQSKGRFNILDEIFIRGRHIGKGISVMISTQKYRALSQNMRTTNSSQLVVYHGISPIDLEAIATENSGRLTANGFKKLYHDNVKKRYSFMIVNQRNPPETMYQDNKLKYIDIEPYLNIR